MAVPDWEIDGTMAKAQRDALVKALVDSRHSINGTAQRLRVGRSTVYRLMSRYSISLAELPKNPKAKPAAKPKVAVRHVRPARAAPEKMHEVLFDGQNYLLRRC